MDIPAGRWIDIRLNEPDVKNVTPPPSAVPLTDAQKLDRWRAQTAVSKLQLIRAINAAGKRSQFNTALTAADQDTQDGWNYASQINRNDPLVAAFAQSTGGTATDVDALFKAAAGAT
jgi:RPA family protein